MSNVRDFGAAGDGRTDATDAILHAVKDGDGVLEFPRGDYLLTRPIVLDFSRTGRVGVHGSAGTAKIIMAGPGPAFHLIGSHGGTADPGSVRPPVWASERLPTLLNIEVEGRHPEADGIVIDGAMQATLEGVLLRRLRDGVRVERRARNLLISHCHIYDNLRTGIFFDNVNLHQAIITGCHVSYNPAAGIKIAGGQVRNVQITGNDIEYNYDREERRAGDRRAGDVSPPEPQHGSADILIDCSPEGATINEGTISGNTIQARISPDGANVRVIGNADNPGNSAGMLAITGNLIGSQETSVHLVRCCSTVVSGNMIYAGSRRNLLIEHSRNIVIGPNSIDHNTDLSATRQIATGIRIADSQDVSLSGLQIKDAPAGKHVGPDIPSVARDGLIEIVRCQRVTLSGLHVMDGAPCGLMVSDSNYVAVSGCHIRDTRDERLAAAGVIWSGKGAGNLISGCAIGAGKETALKIGDGADVSLQGNLIENG